MPSSYSPLAEMLFSASNARPNPLAEEFVSSPSEFALSQLGVPEKINTGIQSDWMTPATYGINAVANRPLLGMLGDFAAGMSLAKAGALPKAARAGDMVLENLGGKAKTLDSLLSTGMTPEQYATTSARQTEGFLGKITEAGKKIKSKEQIKKELKQKLQKLSVSSTMEKYDNLRQIMAEFPEFSDELHSMGNRLTGAQGKSFSMIQDLLSDAPAAGPKYGLNMPELAAERFNVSRQTRPPETFYDIFGQ